MWEERAPVALPHAVEARRGALQVLSIRAQRPVGQRAGLPLATALLVAQGFAAGQHNLGGRLWRWQRAGAGRYGGCGGCLQPSADALLRRRGLCRQALPVPVHAQ